MDIWQFYNDSLAFQWATFQYFSSTIRKDPPLSNPLPTPHTSHPTPRSLLPRSPYERDGFSLKAKPTPRRGNFSSAFLSIFTCSYQSANAIIWRFFISIVQFFFPADLSRLLPQTSKRAQRRCDFGDE